jgi:probable phosphoglycerate mutase
MATPSPSRPGRPKPPPPTLVLLIRHGATPTTGKILPGRAPGLHLAESGKEQAEAVAARIQAWATAAAHGPRRHRGARERASAAGTTAAAPAIYASPLERTRETAAPIAKALGQRVSVNRGLLECDFGAWTGAELKDLVRKPEWSAVQRYPSGFRFPDGESFTAMQARIVDTVATLVSRHRGGTVIVVSHADPIKAVVADALGTHLDLFQRIVVSPCSVTAISYAPTGPTVLAVNSTGTLSELRPS